MYVVVHHTDTDFNDWKSFASYLKFVVETFLRNYSILCQIQTLYVFAYNPVLTKLLGAIWCIGQTFPRVFACTADFLWGLIEIMLTLSHLIDQVETPVNC